MAIPLMLGNIYRTIASYGAKQARKLSPRYLSAASKKYGAKAGKTKVGGKVSNFASKQFGKLPMEGSNVFTQEKIKKVGKGIGEKYGSLYRGTLGTSNRRKVTSGTVGGYMLGSFLAGDDYED
jgi:hypothetical protein